MGNSNRTARPSWSSTIGSEVDQVVGAFDGFNVPIEESGVAELLAVNCPGRNARVPPGRINWSIHLLIHVAKGEGSAEVVSDGGKRAQAHRSEGRAGLRRRGVARIAKGPGTIINRG